MKKIECYQPRGLAKMLGILLCIVIVVDFACTITNANSLFVGIILGMFVSALILLTIIGICVYRISMNNDYIIIRKWYGRKVKFKVEDVTKVVFVSSSGKTTDAIRIHIYIGKKKLVSLDTILENYKQMRKYIIERIEDSKIEVVS